MSSGHHSAYSLPAPLWLAPRKYESRLATSPCCASRRSTPQRAECLASVCRYALCWSVRAIRKLPDRLTPSSLPAQSGNVSASSMLRRASQVRSSSAWTDLNNPAARPDACDPAVCRSTTTVRRPSNAACSAVLRPSAPAPMTTRSASMTPVCINGQSVGEVLGHPYGAVVAAVDGDADAGECRTQQIQPVTV